MERSDGSAGDASAGDASDPNLKFLALRRAFPSESHPDDVLRKSLNSFGGHVGKAMAYLRSEGSPAGTTDVEKAQPGPRSTNNLLSHNNPWCVRTRAGCVVCNAGRVVTASCHRFLSRLRGRQCCLLLAAERNRPSAIRLLVERVGLHPGFASRSHRGESAVLLATECRSMSALACLLRYKSCDVSARDNAGDTALVYAARHGDDHAVTLLSNAYVDRYRHGEENILLRKSHLEEGMIEAARFGNTECVNILVQAGAQTERFQELELAVLCGLAPLAKYLIQSGARVRESSMKGLLHLVSLLGDFELHSLLQSTRTRPTESVLEASASMCDTILRQLYQVCEEEVTSTFLMKRLSSKSKIGGLDARNVWSQFQVQSDVEGKPFPNSDELRFSSICRSVEATLPTSFAPEGPGTRSRERARSPSKPGQRVHRLSESQFSNAMPRILSVVVGSESSEPVPEVEAKLTQVLQPDTPTTFDFSTALFVRVQQRVAVSRRKREFGDLVKAHARHRIEQKQTLHQFNEIVALWTSRRSTYERKLANWCPATLGNSHSHPASRTQENDGHATAEFNVGALVHLIQDLLSHKRREVAAIQLHRQEQLVHACAAGALQAVEHLCTLPATDVDRQVHVPLAVPEVGLLRKSRLLYFSPVSSSAPLPATTPPDTTSKTCNEDSAPPKQFQEPSLMWCTPLLAAALHGRAAVIAVLLGKFDANVNLQVDSSFDGAPAVSVAASWGHTAAIQRLIKLSTRQRLNLRQTDDFGRTALHHAAQFGHAEVIRLLLKAGSAVQWRGKDGRTPLFDAVATSLGEGDTLCVRLLLQANADATLAPQDGPTPLQVAMLKGNVAIAEELMRQPHVIESELRDSNALRFGRLHLTAPMILAICREFEILATFVRLVNQIQSDLKDLQAQNDALAARFGARKGTWSGDGRLSARHETLERILSSYHALSIADLLENKSGQSTPARSLETDNKSRSREFNAGMVSLFGGCLKTPLVDKVGRIRDALNIWSSHILCCDVKGTKEAVVVLEQIRLNIPLFSPHNVNKYDDYVRRKLFWTHLCSWLECVTPREDFSGCWNLYVQCEFVRLSWAWLWKSGLLRAKSTAQPSISNAAAIIQSRQNGDFRLDAAFARYGVRFEDFAIGFQRFRRTHTRRMQHTRRRDANQKGEDADAIHVDAVHTFAPASDEAGTDENGATRAHYTVSRAQAPTRYHHVQNRSLARNDESVNGVAIEQSATTVYTPALVARRAQRNACQLLRAIADQDRTHDITMQVVRRLVEDEGVDVQGQSMPFPISSAQGDRSTHIKLPPIITAASFDRDDVVEFLITCRADVSATITLSPPANETDSAHQARAARFSALNIAVERHNVDMVRQLVGPGRANLETTVDFSGTTPLVTAVYAGQEDIIELLLEAHANPNVELPAEYHTFRTPLQVAIGRGFTHIAEMLIDAGALIEWDGVSARRLLNALLTTNGRQKPLSGSQHGGLEEFSSFKQFCADPPFMTVKLAVLMGNVTVIRKILSCMGGMEFVSDSQQRAEACKSGLKPAVVAAVIDSLLVHCFASSLESLLRPDSEGLSHQVDAIIHSMHARQRVYLEFQKYDKNHSGRYCRADLKTYLIGGREIDDNNFVDFSVDLMSRLFKVTADQGSDDPARSTICSNTTQHLLSNKHNFIEHGNVLRHLQDETTSVDQWESSPLDIPDFFNVFKVHVDTLVMLRILYGETAQRRVRSGLKVATMKSTSGLLAGTTDRPSQTLAMATSAAIQRRTTVVNLASIGGDDKIAKQVLKAVEDGNAHKLERLITAHATEVQIEQGPSTPSPSSTDGIPAIVPCVNSTYNDGFTPLLVAADFGHSDVAAILLRHRANVEHSAADGSTALTLACVGGAHDVIEVLLSEGRANPNNSGPAVMAWSPLRTAVHSRDARTVGLLLAAGADANEDVTNAEVDGGRTLLRVAVDIGYSETIQQLLRAGAKPRAGHGLVDDSELVVAARVGEFELLLDLIRAVRAEWVNVNKIPETIRDGLDKIITECHGLNGGLREALLLDKAARVEEKLVRDVWLQGEQCHDGAPDGAWRQQQHQSATSIFKQVDLDGGGTIDPEEFRIFLEALGFKDLYGVLFDDIAQSLYQRIDIDGDENVTLEEFTSGGVFDRLKRIHLVARIRQCKLLNVPYSLNDALQKLPNDGLHSVERRRQLIQKFALGLPGDWERKLHVKKVHGCILAAAATNDVAALELHLEERLTSQRKRYREQLSKKQHSFAWSADHFRMLGEDIQSWAVEIEETTKNNNAVRDHLLLQRTQHCSSVDKQQSAVDELRLAIEFEETEIKNAKVTAANRNAMYRDLGFQKEYLADELSELEKLRRSLAEFEEDLASTLATADAILQRKHKAVGALQPQFKACKLHVSQLSAEIDEIQKQLAELARQEAHGYAFVQIDCSEDAAGYTPLMLAALHGHAESVSLLIDLGASTTYQALDGNTMLSLAVFGHHTALVSQMLSSMLTMEQKSFLLNAAHTSNGLSPLHIAAYDGNAKMTAKLLQHRADPDALDNLGISPLVIASRQGHKRIVAQLLEHGAPTMTLTTGSTHSAAIHVATRFGHPETISALLFPSKLARAATEATESSTLTTLSTTAASSFEITVDDGPLRQLYIIERRYKFLATKPNSGRNPDVKRVDTFGYLPLHIAAVAVPPLSDQDSLTLHPWDRAARCFDVLLKAHVKRFEITNGAVQHPGTQSSPRVLGLWSTLSRVAFILAEFGQFQQLQYLLRNGYVDAQHKYTPFEFCPDGNFATTLLSWKDADGEELKLSVVELLRKKFGIGMKEFLLANFENLECDPVREVDPNASTNTDGDLLLHFHEICQKLKNKGLDKKFRKLYVRGRDATSQLTIVDFAQFVYAAMLRVQWSAEFVGAAHYDRSFANRRGHSKLVSIRSCDYFTIEYIVRNFICAYREIGRHFTSGLDSLKCGLFSPSLHQDKQEGMAPVQGVESGYSPLLVDALVGVIPVARLCDGKAHKRMRKLVDREDKLAAARLLQAAVKMEARASPDCAFDTRYTGVKKTSPEHTSVEGMTALMVAARVGYSRCVRILLQMGARPQLRSHNAGGQTALHEALDNNHVNVVRLLTSPPMAYQSADLLCSRESDGATPLMLASNCRNASGLVVLLHALQRNQSPSNLRDNGVIACLDDQCPRFGELSTPLILSAVQNFGSVVDTLLGAKASANATTHRGLTPLYAAAMHNCFKVVEKLLHARANPNEPCPARYYQSLTPLRKAVEDGHIQCTRLLIAARALPDTCASPGLLSVLCGGHQQSPGFWFVYESLVSTGDLTVNAGIDSFDSMQIEERDLNWDSVRGNITQACSNRQRRLDELLTCAASGLFSPALSDDKSSLKWREVRELIKERAGPSESMIALIHGHFDTFVEVICGGSDVDAVCPLPLLIQYVELLFGHDLEQPSNTGGEVLPDQLLAQGIRDAIRRSGRHRSDDGKMASCTGHGRFIHSHRSPWSVEQELLNAIGPSAALGQLESYSDVFLRQTNMVSTSDIAAVAFAISESVKVKLSECATSAMAIASALCQRSHEHDGLCFATTCQCEAHLEAFSLAIQSDDARSCRHLMYVHGFVVNAPYDFGPYLALLDRDNKVMPLFAAAVNGAATVCAALLQHGVNPNVHHRPSVALCNFAAAHIVGDADDAVSSIDNGEETGEDESSSETAALRREVWTPLLAAAQLGHERIVWQLLVHGCLARMQHAATQSSLSDWETSCAQAAHRRHKQAEALRFQQECEKKLDRALEVEEARRQDLLHEQSLLAQCRHSEAVAQQELESAQRAVDSVQQELKSADNFVSECKANVQSAQEAADELSPVQVDASTGRRRTRRLTQSQTDEWEAARQILETQQTKLQEASDTVERLRILLQQSSDAAEVCATRLAAAVTARQQQESVVATAQQCLDDAQDDVRCKKLDLEAAKNDFANKFEERDLAERKSERNRLWLWEQQRRSCIAEAKLSANPGFTCFACASGAEDDDIVCSLLHEPHRSSAHRHRFDARTAWIPNSNPGCGTTALIAAARGGHARALQTMLTLGGEQCRPNGFGLDGATALHCAAVYGHVDAVRVLCASSMVNLNMQAWPQLCHIGNQCRPVLPQNTAQSPQNCEKTFFLPPWTGSMDDFVGATALHLAVRFSHFSVAQCLCTLLRNDDSTNTISGEMGAGLPTRSEVDINLTTAGGCTALYFAVVNGERPFVDLLLTSGAVQNPYSNEIQSTMLRVAKSITTAKDDALGTVELLTGNGMSSLVHSMTEKMIAAFAADFDVLESLVAADRVNFYSTNQAGLRHDYGSRGTSAHSKKQSLSVSIDNDHGGMESEKTAVQTILGHLYHVTLNDALTIDNDKVGAMVQTNEDTIARGLEAIFAWCFGKSNVLGEYPDDDEQHEQDEPQIDWERVEVLDGSGGTTFYWTNGIESRWTDPALASPQTMSPSSTSQFEESCASSDGVGSDGDPASHSEAQQPLPVSEQSLAVTDAPASKPPSGRDGDVVDFELTRSDLENFLVFKGFLAKFGSQYFPLFLEMQFMRSDRDCGGTIDRGELKSRFQYFQRLDFVLHNLDTLSTLSAPDAEGLLWFASEGEAIAVRDFIVRRQTDPNCRDDNGCTPLILCCAHGHTSVAELLLTLGADINSTAINGMSPLIAASVGHHADTVQLLCAANPAPNFHHALHDGTTALHVAVQVASDRVCQAIVEGASPLRSPINAVDACGCNPLYRAVQCLINFSKGKSDDATFIDRLLTIIKMFLKQKFLRINTQSSAGWSVLHLACFWGRLDVAQWLLELGARTDLRTGTADIDSGGDSNPLMSQPPLQNMTALDLALVGGHKKCVGALLKSGVSLCDESDMVYSYGISSVQLAAACGDMDIVALLLQTKVVGSSPKHGNYSPRHGDDGDEELPLMSPDDVVDAVVARIHDISTTAAVVLGRDWHIVLDPDQAVLNSLSPRDSPVNGDETLLVPSEFAAENGQDFIFFHDFVERLQSLTYYNRVMSHFANGPHVADAIARVEFCRLLQVDTLDGTGYAEACAGGMQYRQLQSNSYDVRHELQGVLEDAAVTHENFRKHLLRKHEALSNHEQWVRLLTRQQQTKNSTDTAGLPSKAQSGGSAAAADEFDYLVVS